MILFKLENTSLVKLPNLQQVIYDLMNGEVFADGSGIFLFYKDFAKAYKPQPIRLTVYELREICVEFSQFDKSVNLTLDTHDDGAVFGIPDVVQK